MKKLGIFILILLVVGFIYSTTTKKVQFEGSLKDISFRPTKVDLGGGIFPAQYYNVCIGLYIETYNQQAMDGTRGGLCFGSVEKRENTRYQELINQIEGVSNKETTSAEDSLTENFKNQPGEIKSVTIKDTNQWQLDVDLLTPNPKWLPGVDSTGGFFINKNSKIRSLLATSATKTYQCGKGPDNNDTSPDVEVSTAVYMQKIQENTYKNKYFYINGSVITAIYDQCLP